MVEITQKSADSGHFVRGDGISAFRSPIDGTVIDSRSKMEDHCARHGVVPHQEVAGAGKVVDRYAEARDTRAMRELLWEKVDRAAQRGR